MKAGFWLVVMLALALVARADGLHQVQVEINGNAYSNINKVYIGAGNRVIILYNGGGTSAALDAVPKPFLASWGIGEDKLAAAKSAESNRAAADLEHAIRVGFFREVEGVVYDIRRRESGWMVFKNVKMLQVLNDGAILDISQDMFSATGIYVKNLPNTVGDSDVISFIARPAGSYSYVNKIGDDRTIRAYDFGQICSRDEIPVSVLNGSKAFAPSALRGKPAVDVIAKLPDSDDLESSGSGFFISLDGYFITNAHVVRNARRVKLKIGTNAWPVEVVRVDVTNDLALLKAAGSFKAIAVADDDATLGQGVFTIGFPDIKLQGTEPKYTDGRVSSLAGLRDDPLEYQISVPVQPGNSGGPLADRAGNVCGVIVARLDDLAALRSVGTLPQNVNYAVKGSVLRKFLAESPEINLITPNKASLPANPIETVRQAVAIVLVY